MGIEWLAIDGWIVLIGVLVAVGCALPGTLLILRRQSMMGDALTHAALPGIVIGYLLFDTLNPLVMIGAALVTGVATALLIQLLDREGGVEESAAMGVVFTSLFAVGLVLVRRFADSVHIDTDHVLFGAIEMAPLETVAVGLPGGAVYTIPRAVVAAGTMLLVNVALLLLFFKELRLFCFDEQMARTMGYRVNLIHYALITVTATTMVVSFEAVGSIVVLAMLVVPGATARLLSDRLGTTMLIAAAVGIAASVLGHWGALTVPALFGFADASTSGTMALAAGVLFLAAVILGPNHGFLGRLLRWIATQKDLSRDEVLGLLYRAGETGEELRPEALRGRLLSLRMIFPSTVRALRTDGLVRLRQGVLTLSGKGRSEGARVVRRHRLWESFLVGEEVTKRDHVHPSALMLQRVKEPEVDAALAEAVEHADQDPHARSIPRD